MGVFFKHVTLSWIDHQGWFCIVTFTFNTAKQGNRLRQRHPSVLFAVQNQEGCLDILNIFDRTAFQIERFARLPWSAAS